MKGWIISIFSLLFSRKDNRVGVYAESFEEMDTSKNLSDVQQCCTNQSKWKAFTTLSTDVFL
jgi:hypothetical protein